MPGMFEKLVDRAFDLLESRIGLRHLLELRAQLCGRFESAAVIEIVPPVAMNRPRNRTTAARTNVECGGM